MGCDITPEFRNLVQRFAKVREMTVIRIRDWVRLFRMHRRLINPYFVPSDTPMNSLRTPSTW